MKRTIRCQVNKRRYRFTTIAEAARHFHMPSAVVRGRVRAGWKLGNALKTPIAWRKPRPYKPHPDVVAHAARVAKSAVNQTRH